jgi:C-terminal processing protease CtpA/Prc
MVMASTGETVTAHRAVKTLRTKADAVTKALFTRKAMTIVGMGQHENLCTLKGLIMQQAPWLSIFEYCAYGDLKSLVQMYPKKKIALAPAEQIDICVQISAGCNHLAQRKIVHMDIAAKNIMVGKNSVIKIADFDEARPYAKGQDMAKVRSYPDMAIKWTSPEGIRSLAFSEKSDVWAAGVAFWEMFSYGQDPWATETDEGTVQKINEGQRLSKPKSCPDDVWGVVVSTWAPKPEQRPSFEKLVASFSTLLPKHPMQFAKRDIGATAAGTVAFPNEVDYESDEEFYAFHGDPLEVAQAASEQYGDVNPEDSYKAPKPEKGLGWGKLKAAMKKASVLGALADAADVRKLSVTINEDGTKSDEAAYDWGGLGTELVSHDPNDPAVTLGLEGTEEEKEAASKIQAMFKGQQARREYAVMKEDAAKKKLAAERLAKSQPPKKQVPATQMATGFGRLLANSNDMNTPLFKDKGAGEKRNFSRSTKAPSKLPDEPAKPSGFQVKQSIRKKKETETKAGKKKGREDAKEELNPHGTIMIRFTKPNGPVGLGVEDAPGFPKVYKVSVGSISDQKQIQEDDLILEFNGENTIGWAGKQIHTKVKETAVGQEIRLKVKCMSARKQGKEVARKAQTVYNVATKTKGISQEVPGLTMTFLKPTKGIGMNVASNESDAWWNEEYPFIEDVVPKSFAAENNTFFATNHRIIKVNGVDVKGKTKGFITGMIGAIDGGAQVSIETIPPYERKTDAVLTRTVHIHRDSGSQSMGLGFKTKRGVSIVNKVVAFGVAELAGIVVGDEIVEVNDLECEGKEHDDVVAMLMYGGLRIEVLLKNAKIGVQVKEGAPAIGAGAGGSAGRSFEFRTLIVSRKSLAEKLDMVVVSENHESVVEKVKKGGPAALAGLKKGDVIAEINDVYVDQSSHKDVMRLVRNGGLDMKMEVRNKTEGYDGHTYFAAIPDWYEGADVDGDGSLTKEECLAKGMPPELFAAIDTDGDGVMDKEEWKFYNKLTDEDKERILANPVSKAADGESHTCLHNPPVGVKCSEKAPLGGAFCMNHTCQVPNCNLWKSSENKACELHLAPINAICISRQAKPESFGIDFDTEKGLSVVSDVKHKSPAYTGGVKVGETILSINRMPVGDMEHDDVMRLLMFGGLNLRIELREAAGPATRCEYSGPNGGCRSQASLDSEHCKVHACPKPNCKKAKSSKALFCIEHAAEVTVKRIRRTGEEKLGLGFDTKKGTSTISTITPKGLAKKAGLELGQVIAHIGAYVVDGKDNDEVIAMLKHGGNDLKIGVRAKVTEKKSKEGGIKRRASFIEGMAAMADAGKAPTRVVILNRQSKPNAIGVGFVMKGVHHVVSRVLRDSAAERAGIKVGQIIAAVNHVPAFQLPQSEVSMMIKYGGMRVVLEVHETKAGTHLTVDSALDTFTSAGFIGVLSLADYIAQNPDKVRSIVIERSRKLSSSGKGEEQQETPLGMAVSSERGLTRVSDVTIGSPADEYGVVPTDILVSVNHTSVDGGKGHNGAMLLLKNGGLKVTVVLVNTSAEVTTRSVNKGHAMRGIAVAPDKKAIKKKAKNTKNTYIITREEEEAIGMGIAVDEEGMLQITSVKKGTPAQKAGLKKGHVIKSINDVAVEGKSKKKCLALLKNGGLVITIVINVEKKKKRKTSETAESRGASPASLSASPVPTRQRSVTSIMSLGSDPGFDTGETHGSYMDVSAKENPLFDGDEPEEEFGFVGGEDEFGFGATEMDDVFN